MPLIASVKEELLDETHTLVLDKLTVSKSLQAAMVIMDQSNGEVKAIVGGRGEKPVIPYSTVRHRHCVSRARR